ncbi:hypothetical protein NBRC116188_00010 [Oceaniserpentilla sp. 4NH20-0058]|uniref:SRPBCC family protein n=1 Tax=Oceaniserpentilla sp. 4NH20-0058 TaxID=3127660 RepID=UPI003106FC81
MEIACDPKLIFDYVTNSNRWHEWYPSSEPSNEQYFANEVGHKFEIVTVQKPISILPFLIKKTLSYTVSKLEYGKIWQIHASSDLIDSITTYTLTPIKEGTLFKREFRYTTRGWLSILEPVLLRKNIIFQASAGLNNLKEIIESEGV